MKHNDYVINGRSIQENQYKEFDNINNNGVKYKLVKILIAIAALLGICCQIAEIVSYHVYYIWDKGHHHVQNLYWDCKTINGIIATIIFARSIYLQRHHFRDKKFDNGTMQSNQTNILLIFMAASYFATLGALIFYERNELTDCIFNFGYCIGLIFVATHFIGSLRWGKISSTSKNYHWWSANWWCCIYLIGTFFSFMIITVVSPWFGYDDFLQLNQDFENITGEFVHVLIMYGCRPALTIVAFRCIEQILHQLGQKHHDKHNNELSIDIFNDDNSINIKNHSDCLEFHRISAIEFIVISPFILFVVVFDLMTLNTPDNNTSSRINFLIWCFVFGLQCIWSLIVIYRIKQKMMTNILDKNKIISKHLASFISAFGLIIALIGIVGDLDNIWEVWITYLIDIMYIGLQCYSLVLINECRLSINDFDSMKWVISKYGKVVVILHVSLIIHAFLDEGYHLQETMDESVNYDESDVFSALEFIFFFWSIEFHLACIERIKFTSDD